MRLRRAVAGAESNLRRRGFRQGRAKTLALAHRAHQCDTTPICSVFWWGRGSDGWPMLALPIGGKQEPGGDPDYRFFPPDPPVVHLLAAATGIEEHTIAGLLAQGRRPDGDGLADLWGAVDGKLVAIRAEPAEAWRALDGLHAAGDFDGDGMSDVLSNDFEAPPIWPDSADGTPDSSRPFGPRRPPPLADAARPVGKAGFTGGDGRWAYRFMALALPGGDLDGDGAADFVVSKRVAPPPGKTDDTLPLEALSGRTGKWLWSTAISPTVGARSACRAGHRRNRCPRLQSRRLARCIPDVRPLASPSAGAGAEARRSSIPIGPDFRTRRPRGLGRPPCRVPRGRDQARWLHPRDRRP